MSHTTHIHATIFSGASLYSRARQLCSARKVEERVDIVSKLIQWFFLLVGGALACLTVWFLFSNVEAAVVTGVISVIYLAFAHQFAHQT